jgi:hypothetical protein
MAKHGKKTIGELARRIGANAANRHNNYGRAMFFMNCTRQQACESLPRLSQKDIKRILGTNT